MPDHLCDARDDPVGLAFDLWIGLPSELQVDPVNVVGLLVQQGRLPGVKGRLKPEPAFGREIRRRLDIGDQKAFLEQLAIEIEPHQAAHRAFRAIAGDQPIRRQIIVAIRRFHRHGHPVGLRQTHDPVLPAQVDQARKFQCPFNKILFHIVLLQVHKGRHLVAGFGLQVEAEDFLGPMKGPPDLPRHALFKAPFPNTQTIQNFQTALGPANRPAADRHDVVVIQHNRGHAVLRKVDRQRQPDRACTDDNHLVARLGSGQSGRGHIGEGEVGIGHVRVLQPCNASHIARSRSAVQTRGVSMPQASS